MQVKCYYVTPNLKILALRELAHLVSLCSCIDGLVSSVGDVLDSKLRPGLIFRIPGRSSLPSTARHRERPCPATRNCGE